MYKRQVNTVLVNLDSYVSSLKHNYYLYEKDGVLTILPWDYNLSFAGFQTGSASAAVNFPMDTPVSGVSLSERPLLARLLEEESYLAQYHAYIQEIVTGWMSTAEEKIDALDALIGEYVKNDATAFYTYEEYQTGLTALRAYIGLRAQSLTGQLEGTIPATSQGQEADPASLIDASGLVLSCLLYTSGGHRGGKIHRYRGGGSGLRPPHRRRNPGAGGVEQTRLCDGTALYGGHPFGHHRRPDHDDVPSEPAGGLCPKG